MYIDLVSQRLYDKKIKEIKHATFFMSEKYWFSYKGKAYTIKFRSVGCTFQDLQLRSSTQFTAAKKMQKYQKLKLPNLRFECSADGYVLSTEKYNSIKRSIY
jgi:hypothetical protein